MGRGAHPGAPGTAAVLC
ncbi:rCG24820 [Rattus norvegicus]|uniref:RCG24820 n=1 Tax=Rattus norvegicus TaxID=10116 RepID=A6JBN5_RAT|nr:rCG24820 [Rattus norvegicus]